MDTMNQNQRQIPPYALLLLSLAGGLFAFVGVFGTGILFPVGIALGSALCAYAVLYSGKVLLLLTPVLFYAAGAWILKSAYSALPVVFAVPLGAVLVIACRRRSSKTACAVSYATVFAVLFAGWIAGVLYLRYGKLDASVFAGLEEQSRDLIQSALASAGMTEAVPDFVWGLVRILLVGSYGFLCSFLGIAASCLLSLPAIPFRRFVTPCTPWKITVSPIGAAVFLISVLCALLGGGGTVSVTGAILLLLLAPFCMSVGMSAVFSRRVGPNGTVIRISPIAVGLLIFGLLAYTPLAVVILAVYGAVATLIGAWIRHKQNADR